MLLDLLFCFKKRFKMLSHRLTYVVSVTLCLISVSHSYFQMGVASPLGESFVPSVVHTVVFTCVCNSSFLAAYKSDF